MTIEIRVARAGNVALAILLLALLRIGEIETAVDDHPVRITDMARQRGRIDQGFVHGLFQLLRKLMQEEAYVSDDANGLSRSTIRKFRHDCGIDINANHL